MKKCLYLITIRNQTPAESFTLDQPLIKIGRAPDNQIVIKDDRLVSRYHAEIRDVDGSPWIFNTRGQMCVRVNRVMQSRCSLQEGDEISIGGSRFRVASFAGSEGRQAGILPEPAFSPEQTQKAPMLLAIEPDKRRLEALFQFCLWMAEGASEATLSGDGLEILRQTFNAREVQLWNNNGDIVSRAGDSREPLIVFAAHLVEEIRAHREPRIVPGKEIARQADFKNYNFMIGPLTEFSDGPNSGGRLVFIRDSHVDTDFMPEDRMFLRAFCQVWIASVNRCRREWQRSQLMQQRVSYDNVCGIIGSSPALKEVISRALIFAPKQSCVLIQGETGTGKELIANLLHNRSQVSSGPFIAVNCAAIPDSLIEAELFGTTKNAYTGAANRKGAIESARGGTLFLDEIGDMGLEVQSKLLRAIGEDECEIKKLGADRPHKVKVRIVAATHQDLERKIDEGTFRRDLFERLADLRLFVPALRDRLDDVPILAEYFLAEERIKHGGEARGFSQAAVELLLSHSWKGNVRELRNVMHQCAAIAQGNIISKNEIMDALRGRS